MTLGTRGHLFLVVGIGLTFVIYYSMSSLMGTSVTTNFCRYSSHSKGFCVIIKLYCHPF